MATKESIDKRTQEAPASPPTHRTAEDLPDDPNVNTPTAAGAMDVTRHALDDAMVGPHPQSAAQPEEPPKNKSKATWQVPGKWHSIVLSNITEVEIPEALQKAGQQILRLNKVGGGVVDVVVDDAQAAYQEVLKLF